MKRLSIGYLILPGLILMQCGVFEPKENKPREGMWSGNTHDMGVIKFEVSGNTIHLLELDLDQYATIDTALVGRVISAITNNHFDITLDSDIIDFSCKITGKFISALYSEGQIDLISDLAGEHKITEWKAVSEDISNILLLNVNQVFSGISTTDIYGREISDDADDDWQYDSYWPYGEPIYQKKSSITVAQLHKAYPNPSSTYIFFLYSLAKESDVYLAIINDKYQTLKILTDHRCPPGFHSVTWDLRDQFGRRVPSNIYRCVFKASDYRSHGDVWVR